MARQSPPLYRQLYHMYLDRVCSGDLVKGAILPPITDIAQKYGIAVNTVRAAFDLLQRDGYVRPIKKKGTVVLRDELPQEAVRPFLLERREAYIGVCHMLETLAPDMLAFGAGYCGERELNELRRYVDGLDMNQPPRELYVLWRHFYRSLLAPANNERFFHLVVTGNRFVRVPLVLSGDQNGFLEQGRRHMRRHMHHMLDCVEKGDFHQLKEMIRAGYERGRQQIEEYLKTLGAPEINTSPKQFLWMLDRSTHRLYSSIANDLLQKIVVGFYPAGSFIPSQTVLLEEYGASLSSVRGALTCLSDMGVVQYESGKGYRVMGDARPEGTRGDSQGLSLSSFLEIAQMMIVTFPAVLESVFDNLDGSEAAFFHERDNRLAGRPEGQFYSPLHLLINLLIRRIPDVVTQDIYRQLEMEFVYGCHYPKYYREAYPAEMAASSNRIRQAVDCLERNDREGLTHHLLQALLQTVELAKQAEKWGYVAKEMPFPGQ